MSTSDAAPRERRRDIQGLRAIAVLLVVLFHARIPVPGGFIGVDVFFVISGFVIGSALLAELERTSTLDLKRFYARRVRRLLPALAALVVMTALAAGLFASPLGPQQAITKTGVAASLFGANLQLFRSPTGYFDVGAEANALLHTWSLSVEEQFYFLFPSVMLVVWRIGKSRPFRAVVAAVIAVAASSFVVSLAMTFEHGQRVAHALGGSASRFAFYSPVTRAWEFAVGIAVSLGSKHLLRLPRSWRQAVGVLGLCMVAIATVSINVNSPFPGISALAPVGGSVLIIIAGHGAGSIVTRALSVRPLVWLGDMSYGWYLWHWPLIVFASAMWPHQTNVPVAAAAVSLVPTLISYRWLEAPLRRNEAIVGGRAAGLALVCVALGLGAAAGLHEITSIEQQTRPVQLLRTALRGHADEVRLCNGGATTFTTNCTWAVDQPKGTIVLIGDSNAGHFTEVAARAANAEGYSLEVTTLPACPFVEAVTSAPHHDSSWCHDFVVRALEVLVRQRPALVIIGTASTTYLTSSAIDLRRVGEPLADTSAKKLEIWEESVGAVLQKLDAAAVPSVWIHAVPRIEDLTPLTCPYLVLRASEDACALSISRDQAQAVQAPVREVEERAIKPIPSATGVDFTDALCTPSICSSLRDGTWIFRDTGHLTIDGALALLPQFRALIAQHARR